MMREKDSVADMQGRLQESVKEHKRAFYKNDRKAARLVRNMLWGLGGGVSLVTAFLAANINMSTDEIAQVRAEKFDAAIEQQIITQTDAIKNEIKNNANVRESNTYQTQINVDFAKATEQAEIETKKAVTKHREEKKQSSIFVGLFAALCLGAGAIPHTAVKQANQKLKALTP